MQLATLQFFYYLNMIDKFKSINKQPAVDVKLWVLPAACMNEKNRSNLSLHDVSVHVTPEVGPTTRAICG